MADGVIVESAHVLDVGESNRGIVIEADVIVVEGTLEVDENIFELLATVCVVVADLELYRIIP